MSLIATLKRNQKSFGDIFDLDIKHAPFVEFDFTKKNKELMRIDSADPKAFGRYIDGIMKKSRCRVGVGKYLEERTIYDHSALFGGKTRRTVHLGIDLWARPNTKVFAPLEGTVHSFANNSARGDYGPTIVLKHRLERHVFYTLYGHLSVDSLKKLRVGKRFKKGALLARVGNYPINGNWPPHLHFQIIADMKGKRGDFFGVCSPKDKAKFMRLCPDPNLILQISGEAMFMR